MRKSVYEVQMEKEAEARKEDVAAKLTEMMLNDRRNGYFRTYREVSPFTLKEIAEICGVALSTASRWSNGEIPMSLAKQMYVVDLCMTEAEKRGLDDEEE